MSDTQTDSLTRYASLDRGAGSHKKVEKKRSRVLNLYYSNNVRPLNHYPHSTHWNASDLDFLSENPFLLLRCKRTLLPRNVPPEFSAVLFRNPFVAMDRCHGHFSNMCRETMD